MKVKSVGFVGGGRVARIMLGGWERAGAMPGRVVVSDTSSSCLDALRARFPSAEVHPADNGAAAGQQVVFLALHPPAFAVSVPELAGALRSDAIVVSLAPKVTIAALASLLRGFDRIARVIPNAPSIVGSGFNPVAFGAGLPEAARAAVFELLAPLGEAPEVEEGTLEAYAITAAMGPTYLWFQLYELRRLGRSFGLSERAAAVAVEQMARGALDAMAADLGADEVMDLVPVRPLAELEPVVIDGYRSNLGAVMDRIRPA